jgi:hypothetical protein
MHGIIYARGKNDNFDDWINLNKNIFDEYMVFYSIKTLGAWGGITIWGDNYKIVFSMPTKKNLIPSQGIKARIKWGGEETFNKLVLKYYRKHSVHAHDDIHDLMLEDNVQQFKILFRLKLRDPDDKDWFFNNALTQNAFKIVQYLINSSETYPFDKFHSSYFTTTVGTPVYEEKITVYAKAIFKLKEIKERILKLKYTLKIQRNFRLNKYSPK